MEQSEAAGWASRLRVPPCGDNGFHRRVSSRGLFARLYDTLIYIYKREEIEIDNFQPF